MATHVPAVPVAGVWYRHVPAGAAPMPGHPAPDGRWQRGEQLAGLYVLVHQCDVEPGMVREIE